MSGTERCVLVISASDRTLRKVRDLGFRIVHIEDPSMTNPANAVLCLRTVTRELVDLPGMLRTALQLHSEHDFVAVVTNHEPAVGAAQAIADALGLPSSGVGSLLRDKAALRAAIAGSHLTVPWSIVREETDVSGFAEEHGLPVVLKPTSGSASLGVFVLRTAAEIRSAWEQVLALCANGHRYSEVLPVDTYMVEQFVSGNEYSVETVSIAGSHEVVAVVEKTTNDDRVEIAHTVPAALSPDRLAAIRGAVLELLDMVGFKSGSAHTEVIDGLESVKVVESHARTGGAGIPALVEAVVGRDVEHEMLAVLCQSSPKSRTPARARAISKRFLTAVPGRVVGILGVEEAKGMPGVVEVSVTVEVGAVTHSPIASWWRVGEVVAVGDTSASAKQRASEAARRIQVEVER